MSCVKRINLLPKTLLVFCDIVSILDTDLEDALCNGAVLPDSLVSILVFVMIVSIPIVSMPGNKHIKHALEWDFFLGVILFYVLTFFMWKKQS